MYESEVKNGATEALPYVVDVARGWSFCYPMPDNAIAAITTQCKYYSFMDHRMLHAADILALQGFDPADLKLAGFSYADITKLTGRVPKNFDTPYPHVCVKA